MRASADTQAACADAVNVAALLPTTSCTLNGRCPVSMSTSSDIRSVKGVFAFEAGLTISSTSLIENVVAGMELNRRRQPFRGFSQSYLLILQGLASFPCPDFVLFFIGAKMEPRRKNLSLARFASNRHGFELAIHQLGL
jgi:hypothetical protein